MGCKLVLTPHLVALINNFSCYQHPLIYMDSVLQSQDHKLERDRGGGVHAYQFRVTGDSPCHVHIMVPVVVIHHVRERKREREREGGRERACKCLPNSELQVSHHILYIHGTCSKMHERQLHCGTIKGERESKREGMQMLTNLESQVSHHILFIHV